MKDFVFVMMMPASVFADWRAELAPERAPRSTKKRPHGEARKIIVEHLTRAKGTTNAEVIEVLRRGKAPGQWRAVNLEHAGKLAGLIVRKDTSVKPYRYYGSYKRGRKPKLRVVSNQ